MSSTTLSDHLAHAWENMKRFSHWLLPRDRTLFVAWTVSISLVCWATASATHSLFLGLLGAISGCVLMGLLWRLIRAAKRALAIASPVLRRIAVSACSMAIILVSSVLATPCAVLLLELTPGTSGFFQRVRGMVADPYSAFVASSIAAFLILVLVSPLIVIIMASIHDRREKNKCVSDREVHWLTSLTWIFCSGVGLAASGAL